MPKSFEALGLPKVRTEYSVSYLDHNLLYVDNKTPDDHIFLQSSAKKYGLYLPAPQRHLPYAAILQVWNTRKTLFGTDSHITTSGAFGMLAIGASQHWMSPRQWRGVAGSAEEAGGERDKKAGCADCLLHRHHHYSRGH